MNVSIITATFNSDKTIGSALDSVASQTYPHIEHIIVDGRSVDETMGMVRAYQKKHQNIRFISEPDQGIYDALNKGIELSTGDVIGFLHSDDFFENKEVIQDIVTSFQTQNSDGVYGDLKYVNATQPNKVVRYWKSSLFHKNLLSKGWMPAHPTLFLKRELYQTYGNFDLGFKIAADYDFMLRILKQPHLHFAYLPQVITNMRVGGASNRSFKNIIQKSKEDYRALQNNNVGNWWVLLKKNVSKIPQFFIKAWQAETQNSLEINILYRMLF